MAVISLRVSPQIEEFFNKNHSRTDGKFTSGGGGGGGKRTMSLESSTSGQAGKAVRTGTGAATHKRLSADSSTSGTPGSFRRGGGGVSTLLHRNTPGEKPGDHITKSLRYEKRPGEKPGDNIQLLKSGGARVVGGKIHVDGAAATGKIGKRGTDVWHATMTAKHGGGSVTGDTRQALAGNVKATIAERAAQSRVGTKLAGRATTTQRDTDGARLNRMTAVHAEKLSGIGAAKIGDVSVGRGGGVKVKGKDTEFKVSKGSHPKSFKSGFNVSGISDNRGYPKFFSTQAAAKREIAKNVSLAAGI